MCIKRGRPISAACRRRVKKTFILSKCTGRQHNGFSGPDQCHFKNEWSSISNLLHEIMECAGTTLIFKSPVKFSIPISFSSKGPIYLQLYKKLNSKIRPRSFYSFYPFFSSFLLFSESCHGSKINTRHTRQLKYMLKASHNHHTHYLLLLLLLLLFFIVASARFRAMDYPFPGLRDK